MRLMSDMPAWEENNLQTQAPCQRDIRTKLVRFLIRVLTVDQNQLVFVWLQLPVNFDICVRIGHEFALEPIHSVPVETRVVYWHVANHGAVVYDQLCKLFVPSNHASGAICGIDVFRGRVECFEVGQESRCWRLVRQDCADEVWVPCKQFERDNGTGAVADDNGLGVRREVLDELGGIIGIGLKALRVVLSARQIALREASSCTR